MKENMGISLIDIFYIIKRRIILILGITILSGLTAGILSFYVIKPIYSAQSSIAIGKSETSGNDKSQYNYSDVMMFQNLMKTYAEIGQSKAVAKAASTKVGNLTAQQIQGMITVTPQANTQIVKISAQGNNPQQVFHVLNAVCNAFMQESDKVFPSENIQIIDEADVPQTPIKPQKMRNIALGFLIGLMSSIGLTLFLDYLDNTFKTEEELSEYLGIPVIGAIPKYSGKV